MLIDSFLRILVITSNFRARVRKLVLELASFGLENVLNTLNRFF